MKTIGWGKAVLGGLVVLAACASDDAKHEGAEGQAQAPPSTMHVDEATLNRGYRPEFQPLTREVIPLQRRGSMWAVNHAAYDLTVSDNGTFAMAPRMFAPPTGSKHHRRHRGARPTAVQGASAEFQTTSIRRGNTDLLQAARTVRSESGVARIDRGIIQERVAATELGVEQTWELADRPEGMGDLVVRVAESGQSFTGVRPDGVVFADPAGGTGIRYGLATWIDASGARLEIAPEWHDGAIQIRVPAEWVERSAYPVVLDPLLIPPNTTSSAYGVDVAGSSSNFLAVWENYASGYPRLMFSVINTDGSVAAPFNKYLLGTSSDQAEPAVAWDGARYLVVWRDKRSSVSTVRAVSVETNGVVGAEFEVAAGAVDQFGPAVSCRAAGNCLVGWHEQSGTLAVPRARLVSPTAGALAAAQTLATGTIDQYGVSIANNGTSYLPSWETFNGTQGDVRAALVDGSTGIGAPFFNVAATTSDEYSANASWNGTNFVVGYSFFNGTDEDAYTQFTSTTGAVGSAISVASGAGDQGNPVSVTGGGTTLVSYYDQTNVSARTLTSGGALGAAYAVAAATDEQWLPRVAYAGSNFYVSWDDKRTGTWAVRGTAASASSVVGTERVLSDEPACVPASLTASPSATASVGTSVALTASATCSPGATAEYQFNVNVPGSGFVRLRDYGTGPTYNWDTTGRVNGTYSLQVLVRAVGSAKGYNGYTQIPYSLTGGADGCTATSFTMTPSGTVTAGTNVVINPSATCGTSTPEYRIVSRSPGGIWTTLAPYAAAVPFAWNTTGLSAGTWTIQVWARSLAAPSYESYSQQNISVVGGAATCSMTSASSSPATSATVGQIVTISGAATCTSGSPEFQFYVRTPAAGTPAQWTLIAPYGASSTANWNTAGFPTGTSMLVVYTRAAGSTVSYDSYKNFNFTLN